MKLETIQLNKRDECDKLEETQCEESSLSRFVSNLKEGLYKSKGSGVVGRKRRGWKK